MCDNECEVLPTRKDHTNIDVQGFYQRPVMEACNTYVTDLSFSDSNVHAKTDITINHITNINSLVQCGPSLRYTNILMR